MLSLIAALIAPSSALQDQAVPEEPAWGHSHLGVAYDVGPRQRPWKMEGLGQVHLPITANHPEVQAWFDQGLLHLHGFWDFEAERAFRWCLKLDPECAMAYWGLSRALGRMGDGERKQTFIDEAVARMEGLTPLERAFIDVELALSSWRAAEGSEAKEAAAEAVHLAVDLLVLEHPDEPEALSMHFLVQWELDRDGGDRLGREAILQDILDLHPDHPGALHYRVHNWDGKQGRYAIDSCQRLTAVAPESGHLQHMPGHVLSSVGMWHEAAIAMDAATRVEKRYMRQRGVLPENNWDYLHNLDYLSYIQCQLGLFDEGIAGAEQLLIAPPLSNVDGPMAMFAQVMRVQPILRALVMAEEWERVLEGTWRQELGAPEPPVQLVVKQAEFAAQLGLGRAEAAADTLAAFEKLLGELPAEGPAEFFAPALDSMRGRLALANGEALEGIKLLTQAAEAVEETWTNDPPRLPSYGYNDLGLALLELGSSKLAAEAFEKTLETVFHDGVALAGLVQCYADLGEHELAASAQAALEVVWSEADAGNRHLAAARATGVRASAGSQLPERFAQYMQQRPYRATVLDVQGPSRYQSPVAPELAALDAAGERVQLSDYRGSNVLLIFYQGEQCLHCIEQLQLAQEHAAELAELGTRILAVSKDDTERIAGYQDSYDFALLSDPEFAAARRFASYDDFEELELHSTLLIDRAGRVHWKRIGGDPFTDFDFLVREAKRLAADGAVERWSGAVTATGTR
ncbi:MAG: peroxiredoxin family protein [Planctomycetota bacterium]|jgi:peroxiredoxin